MDIIGKKKVLFIDRDGVIVNECQVDSYEKIVYIPHVFEALRTISDNTDYSFVMVSNQDGVGTPSFTYEGYIGPMERILDTLRGERIVFISGRWRESLIHSAGSVSSSMIST